MRRPFFIGRDWSRVRDLFEQGKRNAPCIVFIDEIDAVGRHRGAGLGGGHDEREQTLNQILVEMDGFDTNTNVIVVAATNRPDVLDPALLRPGRFDRQVILDRPDMKGRLEILKVHIKGKPLDKEIDLPSIAKQSPGFSGADLANLVNEAAILAARRNRKVIGTAEFGEALDELEKGSFREVITDPVAKDGVKRAILCSGKIYYELLEEREKNHNDGSVAILRVEQLYPLPTEQLAKELKGYGQLKSIIWAQEEPKNMGAYSFVAPRLQDAFSDLAAKGVSFRYVGRTERASPAIGSPKVHQQEQMEIIKGCFK